MITTIKILQGFSRFVVSDRKLRTTYQTNRVVKYYGFYCALKSITTSGVIKDYPSQMETLCSTVKKSRSSFYSYLNACIQLGLIRRNSNNLLLSSWEQLASRFGLKQKLFHQFKYDTDDKSQTPEYFIMVSEIKENQHYQTNKVLDLISQNPQLKQILGKGALSSNSVKELQLLQMRTFLSGTSGSEAIYSTIHSVNSDVQRKVPSIRKAFGYKSNRSVGYLKFQLVKRGLAVIQERVLKSPKRMRKESAFYYTGWDSELQQSIWQLPDKISLKVA